MTINEATSKHGLTQSDFIDVKSHFGQVKSCLGLNSAKLEQARPRSGLF